MGSQSCRTSAIFSKAESSGSHPLPHAIPTRTTSIMSAEKPGPPGSHPVTMPLRQTSTSSAMSDDAVPLTDPKNTSELLAERLQAWKHAVGSRGLRWGYREDPEGARQGIRESVKDNFGPTEGR